MLVKREVGLATIPGIINQYGGRIRSYLKLNERPESNINLQSRNRVKRTALCLLSAFPRVFAPSLFV